MAELNYSDRPSIVIGLVPGSEPGEWLRPLFNGIEEEQIPVVTEPIEVAGVVQRAYQAALSSRLSVGIAFEDQRIVVHYKNLQENQPLFDLQISNGQQLRRLGANAARLVKGIPFKKIEIDR